MPRFNGTGPMGQGPRTGRCMGPCGGGMSNGFWNGMDRRFGIGRKWTKTEEIAILKEE